MSNQIFDDFYPLENKRKLTQLMTWRKHCGSFLVSPCSRETYESTANSLNFLSSSTLSNPEPLKEIGRAINENQYVVSSVKTGSSQKKM